MYRLILAFLFTFLCFGKIYPQANKAGDSLAEVKYDQSPVLERPNFSKNQIEAFKNQDEFSYIEQVEQDSWWSRLKKWVNLKYNQFLEWLFGDYSPGGVLAFIFKVFPYLVLAAVIGFAVWLLTRLDPGSSLLEKPGESKVFLSEEEEIIQSKDIGKLIEEAIENGQYRLAVRYYYLYNLKKLDDLGIIAYQFQKTNEDYSDEISAEAVKQQFKKITRLYDFIWYGDFKVSETEFRLAEKGFVQMDTLLKKSPNE